MAVVNCEICPRDKCKQLVDGRKVCGFCQGHRAECEARFVLTMRAPADRRAYIEGVKSRRGDAAGKEFGDLVTALWKVSRGQG